ncbi:MAG: ADP-ribosylglycohydrolase family protein, partial [Anaerolineae bacterium]|nr:ADP-ribosylglycohydrolase family protein [Anaerolineae bacterium]
GLGNSTEHTAYLRLKRGIPAPQSGSIALNGRVVAEQIGAQIFIDGWAMVAPGDPELASDLARRAASVSHDGEAIDGAQVIAAMEALAFVESDIDTLLDTGLSLIPQDSIIARLINDVRSWHAREPDWRRARELLVAHYGYDKYGGNCHIVPNHGLIILALLYGGGDFQRSLMIVNTCGWDTDCNSGNLGCLLGIRNGLAGLDAGPDWRGPVADRLYLSTADGGRAITDAVAEAYRIVNAGRALAGLEPVAPKGGARYHFELPGSVQGFRPEDSPECRGTAALENIPGHSRLGSRALALRYRHLAPGRGARVGTATFIPPEASGLGHYELMASPTLYPGQTVRARLEADAGNAHPVACRLYLRIYDGEDRLALIRGPELTLAPGSDAELVWRVPSSGGAPIAEVGLELAGECGATGTVYLDYLTWEGAPDVTFARLAGGGSMWLRAWVNGVDYRTAWAESFRLVQNEGRGLLITGTREWTDYEVMADVTPHMVRAAGIAARVQGMARYYALLLIEGRARLVKALDGETVLAEADLPWQLGETHVLGLRVRGSRIEASIDGRALFEVEDLDRPLRSGGIALVCEEGRTATEAVTVRPVASDVRV